MNLLVDLGCEIIVIACNTATSVAIKDLREELPGIDIIGTEPAVKPAIDENLNKRVLLIATTITVNGEKLHKLIESLNAANKVDLLATDELVMLIENQFFTNSKKEVNVQSVKAPVIVCGDIYCQFFDLLKLFIASSILPSL